MGLHKDGAADAAGRDWEDGWGLSSFEEVLTAPAAAGLLLPAVASRQATPAVRRSPRGLGHGLRIGSLPHCVKDSAFQGPAKTGETRMETT